ncbi:HEAT repeat domain-containing protein [Micromonospora echinospora]|uniref:HEAT repeat domain-containing protein n=1 Tax=Micromonospora echinospora TaxID=1877 RepID=UPI00161E269C|nr:HEAT repeat domain-containing protein [Micromonospora echinospora]
MVPVNTTPGTRVLEALNAASSSARLQAALAVGTRADPAHVDALVARCAIEPNFFVRDMLTWALTRLPAQITVSRLCAELRSERAQARSQALHTLSKIGDVSAYPAVTRSLRDADDEVARSAWRAAVVLVPDDERDALAAELASQLGRGGRDVTMSLSRALVALGDAIEPVLRTAMASADPAVRAHARATDLLRRDPDAGFDAAVDEAKRIVALGPEPAAEAGC